MSVFGHHGVSADKHCFIVRQPYGRLFIPHEVMPIRQNSSFLLDCLIKGLAAWPQEPEDRELYAHDVDGKIMDEDDRVLMDNLYVEAVMCRLLTVDEIYTDSWLAWVGYVEPNERVLCYAALGGASTTT